MLSFKPESIELMHARFPKALEKVWIAAPVMEDRPGLHKEHIFDFESGLRLLISRDIFHTHLPEIHISASWEHNPPNELGEMFQQVTESYRLIGGRGILHFIGWSKKAIPHWFVEPES